MKGIGWRNFHYKSKFLKIPFNPLLSTWIPPFPKQALMDHSLDGFCVLIELMGGFDSNP
jgi:hypothetical protein